MILAPLMKYITGGLLFLTLMLGIALWAERRHGDKLERRITELTELRQADRARYEAAQKEAAIKNQEQIRVIKERQKEITDEVSSDLNSRLELIRRELRPNPAAPGRDPKSPGAGDPGKAPGGATGEAGVCLTPEERLRAAESEERHDQLITWVEKQSQVRP